jgi:amino acid transporter
LTDKRSRDCGEYLLEPTIRGRNVKLVLQRKLNTFDVTNLVVGSIIGADIYIAAAIGSRLVGPSSLLVWIAAGLIAIVIALSFSHCAMLMPRVGGPYAYVKEVSGQFAAFEVGWSLFLAEWFSLAVFPVAFAQYFVSLVPGIDELGQVALKGAFIMIIFLTNVMGVKAAGRFNDALTIAKLAPLAILTISGLFFMFININSTSSNFQPFVTGDAIAFGQALVLIFWAYAGFEVSTLPADEVERPQKTIPKAIMIGMMIVMLFYLVTNFVIIGTVDQSTLSSSQSPLIDSARTIFGSLGILSLIMPIIIGIGALVSILGADESGTIGTSRLAFAMSADGFFPKSFSRLHDKSRTPYVGLAMICATAFIASLIGGLMQLISASVFLLAFSYLATSASTILLERKYPDKSRGLHGKIAIPVFGMIFSILLMTMVGLNLILISISLLLVGIPIYIWFSPKKELKEVREAFLSREAILRRAYEQGERFLAYPIRRIKWLIFRRKKIEHAWRIEEGKD